MSRHRPTSRQRSGGWRDCLEDRDRKMSSRRVETHLPEISLEPCRDRKIDGKRSEAALPATPGKLLIERRLCLAREALVFGPSVHLQPFAVRISIEARLRIGHSLRGYHGVSDNTRGKCHFEVEPVAGETAVQHETC